MSKLDALDYDILRILIQDARTPYTDIAKQLFVSSGTIHVRMRKLENLGIVVGSHLEVNYKLLGYDVSAFLGIYLKESSLYSKVIKELQGINEVISAHYTTGAYSIFARIICRDTDHLREVLGEKIQKISGIQRTETFISLQESIQRPATLEEILEEEEEAES